MGQSLNSFPLQGKLGGRQKPPVPSPVKSLVIHMGETAVTIWASDGKLTAGWLLSEAIRMHSGPETITALKTAKELELLDMWLLEYERKLVPFLPSEHLVAVFAQPVTSPFSACHFEPVKLIGKGAFSRVVLARKRDTGNLYAIKTMSKAFILDQGKTVQIINEKDILAKVRSPFIVKLHWAFQDSQNLFLALEIREMRESFGASLSVDATTACCAT